MGCGARRLSHQQGTQATRCSVCCYRRAGLLAMSSECLSAVRALYERATTVGRTDVQAQEWVRANAAMLGGAGDFRLCHHAAVAATQGSGSATPSSLSGLTSSLVSSGAPGLEFCSVVAKRLRSLSLSFSYWSTSTTGLCVPAVCAQLGPAPLPSDRVPLANVSVFTTVLRILHDDGNIDSEGLTITDVQCTVPDQLHLGQPGAIAAVTVCLVLLALAVVSGLCLWRRRRLYGNQDLMGSANTSAEDMQPLLDAASGRGQGRGHSFWGKLQHAFAPASSMALLSTPPRVVHGLLMLDGIRVISMMWIVLGHTSLFLTGNAVMSDQSRQRLLHTTQTSPTFQFVYNSVLGVDTFFFLSGFLAMHLMLNFFDKKGYSPRGWGQLRWTLTLYSQRIARLLPLYGVVLLLFMFVLPLAGSGPFWKTWQSECYMGHSVCGTYFWTNLLFINNLFPDQFGTSPSEYGLGCMGWSYFLAVDFQLFLLAPPLALLFWKRPGIGVALMLAMILGAASGIAIVAQQQGYDIGDFDIAMPCANAYYTLIFNKPYSRVLPYLVGSLVACLYMHVGGESRAVTLPALRPRGRILFYVLMVALLGVPLYTTCTMRDDTGVLRWSSWDNALFIALHRLSWALGLACLVVGCLFGWMTWVAAFLSWRVWVPLSRLVFATYLTHPLVLIVLVYTTEVPIHYSSYVTATYYAGTLLLSFLAAFVLYVFVEGPFEHLHKLLLPKSR
eukprot:m.174062 g.174062  ORF g.174062 m.174062 type:complete len:727 (+) comp17884_c1_seq3:1660-3840(+)